MSDEPDVFDQLRIAVARMGTRDPKDYSFAISVADAAVILERMATMEAAVAAERDARRREAKAFVERQARDAARIKELLWQINPAERMG